MNMILTMLLSHTALKWQERNAIVIFCSRGTPMTTSVDQSKQSRRFCSFLGSAKGI
jgi:hypothetical protein